MRKAIASIFILLYLFTATEFSQFLRLPILVKHFNKHQSENQHITFFDFLYAHYKINKDIDEDHAEDKQLPFNSNSLCAYAGYTIAFVVYSTSPILLPDVHPIQTHTIFEEQEYNPSFTVNIWQPPKQA